VVRPPCCSASDSSCGAWQRMTGGKGDVSIQAHPLLSLPLIFCCFQQQGRTWTGSATRWGHYMLHMVAPCWRCQYAHAPMNWPPSHPHHDMQRLTGHACPNTQDEVARQRIQVGAAAAGGGGGAGASCCKGPCTISCGSLRHGMEEGEGL
jgi:hypothetical protein